MALTAARALITAQVQSAWNRLRHESGLIGTTATVVTVGIVVIPAILVPSAGMAIIGARLGEGVARGGTPEGLTFWNSFQGIFTVIFAFLGSFRFKPALSLPEFGRFPLSRFDLALAEIPAAVFEVFPLLGVAGIVASNLGLVWWMPAMAPLVAVMTALNVAALLSLTIAAGSAWRLLIRWKAAAIAASAGVGLMVAGVARVGLVPALRSVFRAVVWAFEFMPGAHGYRGLAAFSQGHLREAAAGFSIALLGTACLGVLAAMAHHFALRLDVWGTGKAGKERLPGKFRNPADEMSRLHFRQLSSSRTVWVPQSIPLLIAGSAAFVCRAAENSLSHGNVVSGDLAKFQHLLQNLPLLGVALFLAVSMNSQIWMNQFGWDRTFIRSLLVLPVSPREILSGKFLGLLRLTAAGWGITTMGLCFFYRPALREVIGGLAAAGLAFVVTTAAGQFVSLLAPRAVPPGGMAPAPPLYLSWIPLVLIVSLVMFIAGIWTIGSAIAYWMGPVLLWCALAASVFAWKAVLPQLEKLFLASREKLLSM